MSDFRPKNPSGYVPGKEFTDSGEPVDIHFEQSLVGLVFGDETTPENRQQIMNLNHCRGVHHIGLRWKNSTPWYDWK